MVQVIRECFVELKLSVQTLDKRSNYTVSIAINSHECMYQGSVGFLIFIARKPKDTYYLRIHKKKEYFFFFKGNLEKDI